MNRFFKVFRRIDMHTTTATTEEKTMNMHKEQCTMHNAQCTMDGMKTRRAPGERMGLVARWAAVAAVVAGAWVGGAREAEAETIYWRPDPSAGNWYWDPYPWCTGSGGGGTYYKRPDATTANQDASSTYRDIHFNNNAQTTMWLDAWYKVNYLEFESGASTARTINKGSDGGINIKYGIKNLATVKHEFAAPVSFDNSQYVWADNGNLTFSDTCYLNADVTLDAASGKTITISGVIANNVGKLSKSSRTGTVVLSGANTFTNAVTVTGGVLRVSNNSALGSGAGMTTIQSGGELELTGGITVAEKILYKGVGPSSKGAILSSSGNNTLSGLIYNQSTAGSLLVSSGSSLNLSGTFSNTVSTTVGGAGNITIANWKPKVDAPEMYKTGAGTLTLTSLTKKADRQGLVLNGGKLALTSAGVVTNLAITNATAGTYIDLNGAVKVGVMNIKASTTIKVDVGTTGQNVSESLTTMNDGGWAISSDFNLKLTPGSSFDSGSTATWTILTTQGSFNSTDLGHVKLDTTAFSGLSESCFTKSISGKSIVVTYRPADVPQSTAVSVTELTHTYAGRTITLVGTGGNGTGTAVYTFGTTLKTGTTGTGSLTSAGVLTVTKAGKFVFDVTRAASTGYTARTDEVTITVNKGNQSITGLSNVEKTYGDATFTLSATAQGGTVTYSISPSSVATVSGSTVTIAGAGSATITASQAGNGLWNAADNVTATLTVNKAAQTLSFSPSSVTLDGDHSSVTVTATAGHGSPTITYTSGKTAVAGVGSSSGEVTRGSTGYGNVTITATAAATDNYLGQTATCTVKVMGVRPSTSGSITSVTGVGVNQFTVAYSRGTGATHNVLLAKAGSSPTAPTDGSGPAAQTEASIAWGSAEEYPASSGTKALVHRAIASANIAVSGATPATHYYLALYGRTPNSATSANLKFSSYATTPATSDFWTLATEPSGQASGLTAGTVGSRKASMTWTAGSWAAASGETASLKTLLIVVPSGSSVTAPTDGVAYSAGDAIGAGTVAFAGAGTSAEVTGLTPEQTYTIYAYAYAEGGDGTTANYLATSPASRSITTIASQGPNVWATGVDGTSYLLNWSQLSSDSAGYDVQTGTSSSFSSSTVTETFDSDSVWANESSYPTAARNITSAGHVYTFSNTLGVSSANTCPRNNQSTTYDGEIRFSAVGSCIYTEPIYGEVTSVTTKMRAGGDGNNAKRHLDFSVSYDGGASWTKLDTYEPASQTAFSTFTYSTSSLKGGEQGVRLRWAKPDNNEYLAMLSEISYTYTPGTSGIPGYAKEVTGLTSGSTYYARVRKAPDGDWSDELGVKAGVRPNTVSASAVRNAVTFTWTDVQSGAVGYGVQVTKTAAPSTWADKSAGTAALALGSFGTKDWKYIGTTATTTSSTLSTAPGYASGHIPGVAGNGLESKSFPIAGMTGIRVSFTVASFNLGIGDGQLSDGTVEVYYQIDDGPWCYLGAAAPESTDVPTTAQFDVPAGAWGEGDRVAFKLVAPNAHAYGTAYFISPRLTNVKVSRLSKGSGDYSGTGTSESWTSYKTVEGTTSGTSYTVTGLTAGETVYFRVQALQGSAANPTAKSVWVEATGTATAYTAPGTPAASGILRNAMTLTWTAGDTTDLDHYVLQWSTSSTFASGVSSANVAAGTLTKSLTGLTASTKYYFRVKAVGTDSQESAWSSTGNATTAAYTAPSAITFSSVTRNSMTVSWTAGNTTDLGKYVLQRSTASDFSSGVTSYDVTGGTSQAITGLAASTKYYYRVKAVGTDGQESAWSPTANQTTSGFPGPATVAASGETRNGMTLAWDAVSGAASYNVEWTTCGLDSDTPVQEGDTCPSSTRAYDTHSATDWTYRKGYSSSAGYAAGAYPYWHSTFGHWLAGQYVNTTYKPGVETPALDLSDAASGYIEFAHRKANDGTNTLAKFSPVTLYYSLDGGAGWTNVSSCSEGTGSWVTKTIALPAVVLGRKNVRLQLRADKAAAYYDTSVSAYKPAGAGIKDIKVYKYRTGGDYECAATQSRNVPGTTTVLTGLAPETLYYFRVQAVGSGDGAGSTWTAGSSSTTPFNGPTGLAITEAGRYTLTAGWDAYAESGYTTQYEVQLTPCAKAGAEAATAGECPAQNLAFGTSATDWTYQREYSGSTASSYPKYENGVHKLWGQYSSTSIEPGILSPELDLAGYVSANVEFSHMYVNRSTMSEVALYYSLDEGANWTLVQETGTAAGATAATASSRSIPLPAEALAGGVKLLLRTKHATNYDLNPPNEDWRAQGASIANLKVTARGVGGGDYECGTATAIQGPQSSTSKIFSGLSAGGEYYIRVRTVLTPVGGGAAERSAWTEIPASTAVPQPPPEEIWGESIRQNHMTVAWSEAPGASAGTLYKYEVTKCGGATSTEVAAQETRTDGDLEEGVDDWTYTGGGTAPEATQQSTYGFLRETYPAWARLSENSIVLAGAGSPGIESAEFSTVGASAGTVTFLHGRWYNDGYLATAAVTLSYSIDGGDSWTDGPVQSATDISTAYATYSRSLALPSGALGHAHVKVRLEARAAADSVGTVTKPVGAALKKAKVTLTKQGGDYSGSGCVISSGTGLTADQLSAELEELEAGHAYYFHVAASDGVLVGGAPQYGAWTESMATTKSAPAAPASAWVVPESIGRHAMTVQWDAVADAETYVVKVYQGSSASGTLKQTIETASTSLTVTGLDAQRQYYYTIQSKADGESSSGTANCTGTTSASLAVTGFCVTNILDTSLSVKWDNVADTAYTLEVGPMTTDGATGALYETIECPATTLARSDKGNGWFYLGGNANYPKYYVKSSGTAAQKAEDQGHVLSYSSAGAPGIQSRWFSTFGAKSATIEFLHGRWFNDGKNSALQVFYSIDGGTTWTLAGDIASTANAVPGSAASGGEKTVTRFALPERALGQRTVAIRVQAPDAAAGGSYGYGAEIKDLRIKLEAYPQSASTFSGTVSGGIQNLSGLAIGRRYWFRLTATETYNSQTFTAEAVQTAATRQKTAGVVQSQGFEGAGENGALDTTAWGYDIKYNVVGTTTWRTESQRLSTDPEVKVVDGENPMYGDRALRMSGSAAAGTYGVVEFANKDFGAGHSENVVVTIPFAACDLAEGENLWVSYSTDGGTAWVAPEGLATLTKGGWTMGKIGRGGGDVMNQNWPYNRGTNSTTRPAGDAYSFELHGIRQLAVRVAFCGNSGGAKHYFYIDEVKLERLATPPTDVTASANTHGTVDLGWTPAGGQSVVVIRGQDMRNPPASLDLNSLPHGYEVVTNDTGGNYWVNTADPGVHATATDPGVTGGWKYFYYFYGALDNGDGTYTLSKECVQREVIVRGMVEAIASQGWDGWDVHPWGYKKGRTTNPGRAGDCGYWAYNQSGDTLPYEWAHFVEGSWEYDGQTGRNTSKGVVPSGVKDYAYYYGAGKTYGPAGRTDPDCTNQLGVSSYTNYFGTNCFRLSGGSGWTWYGPHTWTNNEGQVKTGTDIVINTNNPAIQFDTIDLSGYKNVEFSFHYAQTYSGGGNYMHVAISTNGNGADGTWMSYDNKNDGMWRQRTDTSRDYGLQLQTMTGDFSGGNVDFYDESRAPYGNPFVLQVPDAVTQLTVRLTFFDTTAVDQRKALIFVDEVRLTGEVAIEAPKPYISEIGKNQFMVHWEPVADADTYDVEVTEVCDESKIKLAQAFVVDGCPKDWEASSSGATFTKTASRLYASVSGTAHDHGLNLSGGSGALTSPEVGGTTNLQFYAKAYNASGSAKLIVEAKGDKDTEWEEIGSWTAAQLTGSWKGYTNSLPNRQWTQVRFRREGGSGTSDSIYVDDIEFHGEGVYTVAGVKSFPGVSATNQVVTGLASGKRYLAHVRAVGAPAGVVVRSAWGETADWTAGDFAVAADGFEMTRSTWGNPGSGIAVIAVNDGKAFSDVPAPTGTPAVGSAVGQGVVIARTTSAQSGAGFEHVVPYGSRTDAVDQKYVVYWKHGSYWEGRLETNVVLNTYVCAAADAFAVTNGTSMPATGDQAAFNTGKGWAGPWHVETVPWSGAWAGQETRNDSRPYGLLETNQLWGTGGNMLVLYPTNENKKVEIKRTLATPLSKSSEWWGMFTMKIYYSGPNKWAGIQLLDESGASKVSIGKLWNAKDSSNANEGKVIGFQQGSTTKASNYVLNDGQTCVVVFKWDGSKMWLKTFYRGSDTEPQWARTATFPGFDVSETLSMDDIHAIRLVAENGSGLLYPVWFDEIRIGSSWEELVGKEPVPPFPVATAHAVMDGKEMIRLDWVKPAAGTDTAPDPDVERPAATRVYVLEKNVNSPFTADQLAWKTHGVGESSEIGDAVVTLLYNGSGTELEHVVLPGTSHRYAFISYASGVYAESALEVSTDSNTGGPLTMDKYGETEYVNPFSYTNSFEVSGSGTHTEWRGGNGFTNTAGNTVHFWATGDGQNGTTANAATWTPVKPADAPAKMGTEIPNYKVSAGNVMKVSPSANTSASLGRTLAQDWGGEAGKTFYIAYRMAYTYDGVNKWAGLKLIDNSGSHRGVFVGKPGTSDSSKQNLLSIDPGGGLGIGFGNYSLNAGAGNAYVVVAKVQWTAADKVNVYAMAKYADGETEFPEEEPTTGWNAQWINMTFSGVHMIELLAGGTGSDVTPGDTYFDEIRFGGSWDDLLGPKVPTDVWMAGLSEDVFLGDYVVNNITSKPQGPGQSAKHLLSGAAEPSGAAWAAGVDAAWVRNITTETPPQTEWIATNQFKTTGTLYAYGSATGDGETVYSWQHGDDRYKRNTYTVAALPAPVLHATNDASYRVPLGWDRGSSGGRTFEEVMVVKYSSAYAANTISANNLKPEDGKAYYAGDVIYHSNPENYMTVIYRGTAQYYTNRPCSSHSYYAAYTVNNSYYSPRSAVADATPSNTGGDIDIDGDPTDWVGTPAEPWNSSIFSEGELIWTDKRGEERTDNPERCPSADITEFRVKADSTNVYFLLQLNGGTATMPTNAHVAVGLDTRLSTESTDLNWLADESYTFLGGAYYTNSPAFHYPKIQMAVHWVGGDRNEWQVELYDTDSASWHAPLWWKASSALDGSGNPVASATPCVEWVVPRNELGLDGVTGDAAVTGRFSVATFLNSGSWNNEAVGVVLIASNSCAAVDALAIAPYGSNDKDYALGAWDEGLKNNNVDFWMDARFGATALLSDTAPSTPANPEPANDGTGAGNPVLQWSNSTDAEGFVTGWLLEVADTPNFGGDGGHTENGPVLYRVNIEMTPELAAAIAATPSRKISFKPMTNCKEFWWRVRARDNAGQLSAATVQHYTVTGKQDNDGPVATLKYVGSQVGKFLGDSEYRAEVERNGEAYSILDSEFGGSSAEFGFVIEWYDINGVYATNHMRGWVNDYDGVDDCDIGPSKWPAGKVEGDYTWNILATNGDGTVFGRVSPNWDLMMVNTNRTSANPPSPLNITVHTSGGEKTLTWEHHGGTGEPELLIPDAMGEYQPAQGWVIQWGYDDAFLGVGTESGTTFSGQTLRAYDGGTEISCNGVQYLTNYVSGVFGLPEYDPEVDLYLTLSAEDCCTSDQWGEQPWDPWPPSTERDHQGSYRGLSCNEVNVLTGGWCADGPNPARNVTVNQLIKINVKDNDVVPPIASTERWAATAVDEDGTEFKPSMLVSTNNIAKSSANTTWATITGKLPRREGVQRDTMYQLTDAMMVGGTRPLSFFFNVFDDYIESGTQRGATQTTTPASTGHTLTNSAFVVKTWDPALNEGAGAWVASTENTGNFVADGSYISDMVHDGSGWHEAAGTKGTGPSTVLRWDFATSDINSLFGMTDILSYIGTHSDGVTNVVQLHAWDSDDNRANDQADAEITFGRLLFSDDDATAPEISRSNLLGTGTNMVKFGTLALDTFSKGDAIGSGSNPHYGALQAFEGMTLGTAQVVQDGSVAVKSKAANGTTGSATLYYTATENPGVAYMESGMNGASYLASSKYFEWVLGGTETAYWLADNLTFKSYVTAYGPTRYTLTVQGEVTETVYTPSASQKWTVWQNGAATSAELTATNQVALKGSSSVHTAAVQSVSIPLTSISSGTISYDAGARYNRTDNRTLKLQISLDNGASWTDVTTIKPSESAATGEQKAYVKNFSDIRISGSPLVPRTGQMLVRWYASNNEGVDSGVNGNAGFNLWNPKVTTVKGTAVETELGTVVVDKEENGEGQYFASTNLVSIVFSQSVEATGTQKKTFRLYGWRATGSVAEDEADDTFSGNGNWGINNLELHGILSGPKGQEVTDHDLNQGAWTNTLEVQDGLVTGYDTVRSGLWVASNSADNCHAWVPDFTVYYPAASAKEGAEFWSSNLVELAYAEAELASGGDPQFADDDGSWTLASGAEIVAGTTESRNWLSLPGGDSKAASASQTIVVAAPERGLEGVTVIVQAKVRSVLAAGADGAANGFTLGVDFQTSAGDTLSIGEEETFSATKAWREYTLGPVSVANSSVGKVAVSIAEETTAGTGLEVDSVVISVSAFAPMVNSAPGTGKNGEMVSAQLKVRTQGLSAETLAKGMPLSVKSGSTQPDNQHYKIVSRVYDYDHDRTADARAAAVTNAFWLYDNDEAAPQTGSQFGGPFGVKVNGTLLPTKQRINSGAASVWALSDHSIAEAAGSSANSKLGFALDYYDYSGWRVTDLQFRKLNPATGAEAGTTTVLSGGTVDAAGTLAGGYSRDAGNTGDLGEANVPSATVGWEQAVLDFYTLHAAEFASDAIVTNAVYAGVTDRDNDRAGDTLATGIAHVGNFRVMDQDVSAPHYRNASTSKFKGILVATNVADGATLQDLDSADYGHYALGGSLSAHNGSLDDIATRAFTIYDGELREVSASKQFAVTADLVDPSDRTSGRSNTGVKRGTAATEGASSALASSITLTNTYLAWETAATNGIVVSNALAHYQLPGTGWSSSDGQTKMAASVSFTTWTWDEFTYDDVGNLLPGGQDYRDLWLRIHAYDADADRQEDQKYAQLAGPKITVRDNDTLWPNPPTGLEVNGTPVTTVGEMTRETAPWTNNLGNVNVRFTAATDQDPTGLDTKKSGVVRYHLAGEDATITHTSTNAGKKITTSVDGEKLKANLGAVTMDQGFGKYQLFAVDGDNDRPGDGLASDPVDVPLAYDITKPTKIGYVSGGSPRRLTANPDNTDDPTTQFDLSWPIYGVGPDDPADPNYIETTYKASAYETLSPWYSYKIYFTNYEESAIASDDNPDVEAKSWVYQTFMSDPTAANYYTNWAFVMTNSPVQDPTAPKDTGTGRSTAYDSLGRVAANVGTTNQSVRLYDLDFDNHYIVIIVGVDKAGNEGPAGMWSWATNNTIKFAVTAGVVRTTAAISGMLESADLEDIGMAVPGEGAPSKAAVLHWLAAGQDAKTGEFKHAVNKQYDLIYRDASSFTEKGTEQWNMASTAGNSGTSKTNWNYQADAGLATPGRLRFYRASYTGRWQDTKPGTDEKQIPLASMEVYSMNNVVLSEGFNYVSLQGVPWTNTFRGVFGTDPSMWPAATNGAASDDDVTKVEFYSSGTTTMTNGSYFFAYDKKATEADKKFRWFDDKGADVTDKDLPANFFARPFGILLPKANITTNNGTVETNGWWKDHTELKSQYGRNRTVLAMLWHPIMQVPTNGVPVAATASTSSAKPGARDGTASKQVFQQTVVRGKGVYNLLSLNLPVAVHPSKLMLVEFDKETGEPTSGKMKAGNPWDATTDKLYVVDTETKEPRGDTTMYCDANGTWRYNKNRAEIASTDTPIHPNDMIVLISGKKEEGAGDTWNWTYSPEDFYQPPTRNMGR